MFMVHLREKMKDRKIKIHFFKCITFFSIFSKMHCKNFMESLGVAIIIKFYKSFYNCFRYLL